jgi:hypothetical protein
MKFKDLLMQETKDTDTNNWNLPYGYPFWKIPDGVESHIRFLRDLNADNKLGMVQEIITHRLEIAGKPTTIPCLTMYGEACPICQVSRAFYSADDKANGLKYWKKQTHYANVLVVKDGNVTNRSYDMRDEHKVMLIGLRKDMFANLKSQLHGLEYHPCDESHGTDYIIRKSTKNGFADYANSGFAGGTSALPKGSGALISEQLIDLSSLIPSKPELADIQGLLSAALRTAEPEFKTPPVKEPPVIDFDTIA